MIFPLTLALLTVFVMVSLIALTDHFLRPFWGGKRSVLKAILFFFTALSLLYQAAFVSQQIWMLRVLDVAALLAVAFFWRPILGKFKEYAAALFQNPWRENRSLYFLYFFLAYLLVLAIFSVPGWNWDSMVHALVRPFLFLNEKNIFTPYHSDFRQVGWPMGADLLIYLFTRNASTLGVGLMEFIFYCACLMAVHSFISEKSDRKTATTFTFVAASLPLMIYCASSDKSDLHITFALMMIWLAYHDFRASRRRCDLFLIFLALAFGLTCKLSFAMLGPLSVLAMTALEIFAPPAERGLKGKAWGWPALILLGICFLFLSQIHIYLYNWTHFGYLHADQAFLDDAGFTSYRGQWPMLKNFAKHQLMFVDFVLPLKAVGFPFIDSLLNWIYNHTAGWITHDVPWDYQYFPEEMYASCGPFGILIWLGIYLTAFRKSENIAKAVSWMAIAYMLIFAAQVAWQPVSAIRYFLPAVMTALIFLERLRQNRLLQHHAWVRAASIALLIFCNAANYAKPLIAYHPKAVPWYTYAFTDRQFLYHGKYFKDDRMEIYKKYDRAGGKIFVFLGYPWTDWVFPYYENARRAFVRQIDFRNRREIWSQNNFAQYDLIVCNGLDCMKEWDAKKDFVRVWKSAPNVEKQAAFYEAIRHHPGLQ